MPPPDRRTMTRPCDSPGKAVRCQFLCLIVTGLLAIFPDVNSDAQTAGGTSGIEGVILVSPPRPGPLRKEGPSVAPAGHLEFVVKKADARVTTFTTDEAGKFRVSLPPGHYVILREDSGVGPGHWQFEADVGSAMTKVTWTGDSGMR